MYFWGKCIGVTVLIFIYLLSADTFARRGCCSWHGGVKGCDRNVGKLVCNDGTYSPSCGCEEESNNSYVNHYSKTANPYFVEPMDLSKGFKELNSGIKNRTKLRKKKAEEQRKTAIRQEAFQKLQSGDLDGLTEMIMVNPWLKNDVASAIRIRGIMQNSRMANMAKPDKIDSISNDGSIIKLEESFKVTKAKAEKGDAVAQYTIGNVYHFGEGVPENYTEAMKWYQKAALQGHTEAQYSLGEIYKHSQMVPKNYGEAMKWHQKAALQGHAGAQISLGLMYYNGWGAKNYIKAYLYMSIAAAQGNYNAKHNLPIIKSKMSPSQIAEAQKQAKILFEKIKKNWL